MEAAFVAAWDRRDREIATSAILLAVIAVAVGAWLLTGAHNDSTTTTAPLTQVHAPRPHGHLLFGMTPQQVLRRTGHPVKTQGNCWLFAPTKAGIVGSISVQPSWSRAPYDPRLQGGLRLCFTGGHYSNAYQHIFDTQKQKWVWFAWPQTLMRGATDYSDGV